MDAEPGRTCNEIGGIKIIYNEKDCSKFLMIAPMSSGKSTLINALLGKKMLRTSNFACTSRELRVLINNRLNGTFVYLEQENGTDIVLRNLDDRQDNTVIYHSMEQQCKRTLIETCGRSSIISSKPVMLIDTPGGNYSGSHEHKAVTRKVLEGFNNGTIVYALNATQIGTEDDYRILSEVKSYITGKNVKVIFVLNKIDEVDTEKEVMDEFIRKVVIPFIEKVNITDYLLFPCASEAALLFKCAINEDVLSEAESDKLYKYYKYYYKAADRIRYAAYDSDTMKRTSIVVYDEEQYDVSNIGVALGNTGIYELERYISQVSTKTKRISIRTKEKK